jgi:hypothetical protein
MEDKGGVGLKMYLKVDEGFDLLELSKAFWNKLSN